MVDIQQVFIQGVYLAPALCQPQRETLSLYRLLIRLTAL